MRITALFLCLATALVQGRQDQPFRATVEGIELDVAVTRGNIPVRGLTARDFVVTDNGAVQDVSSVTLEEAPLSVVLVLDVSRSVSGGRLQQLIGASVRLADSLRPDDEAALVTFSHKVELRVPATLESRRLKDGLASLNGVGSTSLRDAVYLATQIQPADRRRRPLVLLFSDGDDTASWLSEADVLAAARRSAAVVHIVTVQGRPFLIASPASPADACGRLHRMSSSKSCFRGRCKTCGAVTCSRIRRRRETRAAGTRSKVTLRNQRAMIVACPGYVVPDP